MKILFVVVLPGVKPLISSRAVDLPWDRRNSDSAIVFAFPSIVLSFVEGSIIPLGLLPSTRLSLSSE